MRRQHGFSLIELLIVVAIILIIAAMAIPNLLRAKIAANEASAANSIRKIATAEVAYNAAYPTVGFATALTNLGGPISGCTPNSTTACILDGVLSSGAKSGYTFVAVGSSPSGGPNSQFVTGTAPQSYNVTGVRVFCSISDGVLRGQQGVSGGAPVNQVADCLAYPVAP